MKNFRLFIWAVMVVLLASCSTTPDEDKYSNLTDKEIYALGQHNIERGKFDQAVKDFEGLEARYPFGTYAELAQLGAIYAYYKNDEPDAALAAADRFLHVHPTHKHADYVYYMKGIINFGDAFDFPDRYLPMDPSDRDPSTLNDAFLAFSDMLQKHPKSKYADDARQRMIYLRNILARHEVNVARYYMKRKAYLAAANRATFIVEHYQHTEEVPESLAIMADAYDHLGLDKLSKDARVTLRKNYPNSEFLG